MARMKKPGWSACEEFKEEIALMNEETGVERQSRIKPLTRATKEERLQVKANLKAQLPVLTSIGVRRFRVPYHESVILELEESGMVDTANHLKKLFLLDKMKSLESQRNLVDYLKNRLIAVEVSKKANRHQDQVRILLNIAIFFKALSSDWLWVADELLKDALDVAEMIQNDGGLMMNATKFIYGQFLFHDVKNLEEAMKFLKEVRSASEGKRWNASKLLNIKEENLFRESNALLYKILLILAEEMRKTDAKMAVKASLHALKHANDSDYEEHVARALHELGQSHMAACDVKEALKCFTKFLAKAKRIPDAEGICDALKELAFAHKALKDNDGTLKYLRLFRKCAEESKLSVKLAEAHYFSGKYLLRQNQPSDASCHLKIAFDLFKSLEMREEMDRSRFLLGVSKGEEVMEEFMELILKCGNKDEEATMNLLEWKNRRIPFWKKSGDIEEGRNSAISITDSSSSADTIVT